MRTLYQHAFELVEEAIFTPKARRMFDGLFRMMNDTQGRVVELVLKIGLLDEQQPMNIVTLTALFVSLSLGSRAYANHSAGNDVR